jgi:rfaE bifunctional protein kinase chain/domain
MNRSRFQQITSRYPRLRVAVVGDFCLDRYLEIDPARTEVSIETGRPVHNVVRVRSQPGAAGTILNNLVALGVGEIYAVGFCGEDGEGWELQRCLRQQGGVLLDHWIQTSDRRTFTYTKPLIIRPGKPPEEQDRLDFKNWTACPPALIERFARAVRTLARQVDAMILMDQVDLPETGMITQPLLRAVAEISGARLDLPILADSRRGLRGYPKVDFKMNAAELAKFLGASASDTAAMPIDSETVGPQIARLAKAQGRHIFVTLAESGILGASPAGEFESFHAFPVRGEIDVVGAGDAVTANLAVALSSGATLGECLELAMAAASIVLHQLGTTGTASVPQLEALLESAAS